MKNNKIENDPLSIEQALLVFGSKPNVVALVKPLTKQLTKMNPAIILQDPREWANLSDVLLMRGLPDNARLDFDLAAKQFNERIKKAAAGNPNPPKELTEGEYRKGAVAATRKRLQEAQAELIQTNDPANNWIILRQISQYRLPLKWLKPHCKPLLLLSRSFHPIHQIRSRLSPNLKLRR
jgi:hypothetical protein